MNDKLSAASAHDAAKFATRNARQYEPSNSDEGDGRSEADYTIVTAADEADISKLVQRSALPRVNEMSSSAVSGTTSPKVPAFVGGGISELDDLPVGADARSLRDSVTMLPTTNNNGGDSDRAALTAQQYKLQAKLKAQSDELDKQQRALAQQQAELELQRQLQKQELQRQQIEVQQASIAQKKEELLYQSEALGRIKAGYA
jgi:hypothetical protein